MPIVEKSITIRLPCDEVYRITQDYSVRFAWDPFPERLEMLGGGDYTARIGGQVFVRSKLGMEMVVEFVQVNPPKSAAIKMVSGPWFLEKFAGSWIFDTVNADQTAVRFRYLIHARGFIVKNIIEAIAVIYFRWAVDKRLLGLRDYCEKLVAC